MLTPMRALVVNRGAELLDRDENRSLVPPYYPHRELANSPRNDSTGNVYQ